MHFILTPFLMVFCDRPKYSICNFINIRAQIVSSQDLLYARDVFPCLLSWIQRLIAQAVSFTALSFIRDLYEFQEVSSIPLASPNLLLSRMCTAVSLALIRMPSVDRLSVS